MAKLKQLLGAILNDVMKAQAISDAYSRDLKLSYQEDPSLKLLSVPRTEIKDITIDLKFAILKAETGKPPERVVTLYNDVSYQGTATEIRNNTLPGTLVVRSLQIPKGIRVTLYEEVGFTGRSKRFTEDTPSVDDDIPSYSSIRIEQSLAEDIGSMEIEVVTEQLMKLPGAAISSIAINLGIAGD